jgi:hypothetical protein
MCIYAYCVTRIACAKKYPLSILIVFSLKLLKIEAQLSKSYKLLESFSLSTELMLIIPLSRI